MAKLVVILNGPIGAGKSTIGAAVAARLGGAFIESDELGDPPKAWHEQVGQVNREIVTLSIEALSAADYVVVARPLGEAEWKVIKSALCAEGISAKCLTLTAQYEAIVAPSRGRRFEPWEHDRIREMIDEGYGNRPFSDAVLRTGDNAFDACLDEVTTHIQGWGLAT